MLVHSPVLKLVLSETSKMRLLSLLLLLALIPSAYSQAMSKVATGFDDRVVITPRKVVIVRRGELARQFPERKRATVTYPIISGLKNPQVLRRVQSLLQVRNAFDSSLQEYRESSWLEEASYAVNYNKNHILDITFSQNGTGAYPDTSTKHFAINLKSGSVVKASDVFVNSKLQELATLLNHKLQTELKEIVEELISSNSDPEDVITAKARQEPLEFKVENLDEFSVSSRGITFLYDAGYPHVIQALEPNGRYFLSYSELKPYIKRDGLLGQFVK
jgi:hypothetical protein